MTDPDLYALTEADEAALESRNERASPYLRSVGLTLGVLLGWLGAHRFYVGKVRTGIAQLLTLGGLGLWWFYDMILLVTGEFRDVKGRRVSRWNRDDPMGMAPADRRRVEDISGEMERLRTEVSDLAERVDFAERMLAQQRERPRLP